MIFHRPKSILRGTLLFAVSLALFYSCGKELSTTPGDPPPPTGLLKITSSPSGSTIWLNGRNTGRTTPDSVPWIEAKEYQVTLKRYRWKDTSFVMTAVEDNQVEKFVDYYSNPSMYGNIEFDSEPRGASIYLNDSLLSAKTPYTIRKLVPGRYSIRYEREQHRAGQLFIDVISSKTTDGFLKLRDTSVWVDYQTHNSNIPTNKLTGIINDSSNLKWISTANMGLLKYDGSNFEVINKSNSMLPSNTILTMEVDEQDNKWIGTDNGLAIIYTTGNWEIINSSNSKLPSNRVTAIEFTDVQDKVIIGTTNNVVLKNGNDYTVYRTLNTIPDLIVTDILYRGEFDWWIGTSFYGLYYFSMANAGLVSDWTENPLQTYVRNNYPSNIIAGIEMDSKGYTWVASNFQRIEYQLSTGGYVNVNKNGGLSVMWGQAWSGSMTVIAPNEINDMKIDENDIIWLATDDGLQRYDNISHHRIFKRDFNGLSSSSLTGVVKDKNGIVWVTSSDGGLNKYKAEANGL